MFAKAITLSGLATLACAHIKITNPVPYGKNSLNNSPLDASGSDFPCKQRPGVYDADGASNVYAQGSTQQLAFLGTAVHGGGSCQVSITTDLKPTKDSVWKVIKSIEGGCPAKGQTGNMGNNAGAEVPYKYDFDIPKELAAGNYTLAWTWFNKVGNREMYMNCAPMTVTGSDGSDSFMSGLPDMFVANVGNGCGTKEGTDVQFPNPGVAVAKFNVGTTAFDMPTAAACGKPTGGSGNQPAPTNGGGDTKPSAPAESNPEPTPSKALPGGVFITKPAEDPVPTTEPAESEPAPTEAPSAPESPTPIEDPAPAPIPSSDVPSPAPGNDGGDSSPSPSGGYASGTACSEEGAWNCIDGKSFQRCASGMWSPVQAMAAGVSCEAGVSTEFKMTAIAGKRAMRRALRMKA
ncbi:hypothetical protein K4F52_000937 [Lecanicillium sp. MT-2017a]|nr:hypothetical protein K4F52_000937 [Lecanicillium sp. MT-2017a]